LRLYNFIRVTGLAVLLCGVIVLVVAQNVAQNVAQDDEVDDAVTALQDVLFEAMETVRGLVEVVDVSILINDEDEDDLIVTVQTIYITRELNELGYRAEILDVYYALGEAITEEGLVVEFVVLLPSVSEDIPVETVIATMENLTGLLEGDLSRSEFLESLEVFLGERFNRVFHRILIDAEGDLLFFHDAGLQHEKEEIEFFFAPVNCIPGAEHTNDTEERGQDNHDHREVVRADGVGNAEFLQSRPRHVFPVLEGGCDRRIEERASAGIVARPVAPAEGGCQHKQEVEDHDA